MAESIEKRIKALENKCELNRVSDGWMNGIESRIEALEGELRAEEDARRMLIDSLAGSVDKLANAVYEVQQRTPYPAEVDGLIDKVAALERRLNELWPYAQTLEERIEELEDKAKAHGAALDNLRGRHERLSDDVAKLHDALEQTSFLIGQRLSGLESVHTTIESIDLTEDKDNG